MKIEISSSVHLFSKESLSYNDYYDFKDPKAAIQFFDKKIHSDDYLSGYIKVQVKKG